jgi:PAS domain S-box-containing protein
MAPDISTGHIPAPPDDACFRLAMASAGIGMAIVSLEGAWLEVNPALCRMLGADAQALLGHNVREFTDPADAARTGDYFAELLSGARQTLDVEKRYRHGDGRVLWANLNLALMRDEAGAPRYFIAQLRDITVERAANEELERRVQARTAELQALNKQLELFAFGVSHDLRAPLRSIDSFASVLEHRHARQLDAEGREHLARIRKAAGTMGRLIDGLLELSRATRAEVRKEPVDVSLLAEWVGAELQDAEPARAARIEVQPGLTAVGDERLLKMLLAQLMDNAWKFSTAREQVRIDVGGQRDADGLQLWVRDAGCGFNMAYADKVFEPFKRVHGPEEGGGNGLGLAIARRVVERHGGSIDVQSTPGTGTTVHVRLPELRAAA